MEMLEKSDQEGSFLSSCWIISGGCGMALSHCILPIRRASVGLGARGAKEGLHQEVWQAPTGRNRQGVIRRQSNHIP